MPRQPRLNAQARFFARIDRFVCECPSCGCVIKATYGLGQPPTKHLGKRLSRARTTTYNPLSSRVCCPECRRAWGVGLLLYPLTRRATGRQPSDQKPTYAQLLDLRRLGGGFIGDHAIKGDDAVNICITADCTCPEVDGGLDMACPVHGWDATNAHLEKAQKE